ncbi:hypothetical protein LRAMOSA07792 [Lichtheimia ramosa]|uniref:BHLH domain-containing protein n=1 Tax=Lichtheimia ramosa TaxID=688394 RepID=A0A077WDU0_9FUNG|nr:hypothetical protein LRAMOSA07792 [Lichtheimia ramosa]
MSEIVLSNTTTCSNQYIPAEYSNPDSIMSTSAFDSMVEQQKMDSPSATAAFDDGSQQQQQQQQQQPFYQGYGFQQMQMNYQAMPMAAAAAYQMRLNGYHPTSPDDSMSSNSSPQTPPAAAAAGNNNNSNMGVTATTTVPTTAPAVMDNSVSTCSTAAAAAAAAINFSQLSVQPLDNGISPPTATPLLSSSSSTTTFSNSTTERVKETIARANSVPMEFYHTEFLEYSKETYERKMDAKRNKRKRSAGIHSNNSSSEDLVSKKKRDEGAAAVDSEEDDVDDDDLDERNNGGATSAELRRQIHIQSEQKRRAQIKDGFDELRKHLPGCNNKKMSKAALLTRTVQQIQHLKNMQSELLAEVERLVQENDNLKKFQHNVLQRQAMEKMYSF